MLLWYDDFTRKNPKEIMVCKHDFDTQPKTEQKATITAAFRDQVRLLSRKVNRESSSNQRCIEQMWSNVQDSKYHQRQVSSKLGQLTKLQNQQAAKELEQKRKADKKAAKRAELEANKKKGK